MDFQKFKISPKYFAKIPVAGGGAPSAALYFLTFLFRLHTEAVCGEKEELRNREQQRGQCFVAAGNAGLPTFVSFKRVVRCGTF